MIAGYICVGLGFGGIGLMTTVPGIIACLIVFSVGEMLTMPLAVAQIADLAPANMRGRYMGGYGFTWAIALMFAPIFGSTLFEVHPAALWVTCGCLAFAAAGVISRRENRLGEDKRLADFA
jgi:MFS family permease